MMQFIMTTAMIILWTITIIFNQDFNMLQEYYHNLKYICEDAAADASLYYDVEEYSLGRKVFNQAEGIKAIENQIRNSMHLDSNFVPMENSYWTEKVSYKVYFYDDSNTVYPYLFQDQDTMYTKAITSPTVIVTINAGPGRFRLPFIPRYQMIRSSAYEWKQRNDST